MKSKRLIIISIFLIFLCLNVVSASENADDGIIAVHDDSSVNALKVQQTDVLSEGETGNFTELSNFLSGKTEVTLDKDYKCADGESVITLPDSIIINGNGHKIDADKKTGIFSIKPVSGNQITLNNITFTNANSGSGGAINQGGDKNNVIDLTITNCNFINNVVSGSGGAVYSNTNAGTMIFENNTFINCTANACGAMFVSSPNVKSFYNNTFINNTALGGNAGALQVGANVVINKSKFINNKASKQQGGAIFCSASNLNVINSEFINNTAKSSEGGAIYAGGKGLNVTSSLFDNNLARYGGAISSHSANSNITYSNFTNNDAKFDKVISKDGPRGAGIYFAIAADNSFVSNCYFELNEVIFDTNRDHLGASIYIGSDNVIVTDSIFKNNSAGFGGGVYSAQGANNTLIKNCNFTENHAQDTGAGVSSVGGNPTISSCNFIDNKADLNGGGLYVDLRNEDEGAKGNEAHVSNCNFTGNYAYASGGGIHLRDKDSKGFTVVISDCLFENNTANIGKIKEVRGGGAVSVNGPANMTNCEFNGNNATRGSAIRLAADKETTKLYLENTVFGKNRANSTQLTIDIDKPVSYYPSNVTINVTLYGWDNIANAIWNEKTSEYVYTSNITYDAFIDGELVTVTTPVGFKETVDGYKNSNNGDLVWQDDRENAQNINLKIYRIENGTLGASKPGVLSAINSELLKAKSETFIAEINAPLTDLSGTLSNIQKGLKPGNYTVKASHAGDEYYTEIGNQADFEILSLNITKTTDDVLVGVTDNVTYNITINNSHDVYLSDIKLTDLIPDGFELLNYSTTWPDIPQAIVNDVQEYGNWTTEDGKTFYINNVVGKNIPDLPTQILHSALAPNDVIVLTLTFKATKAGTFNNTVTLKTNETDPINTTSENTTIMPCILTVNKTANVTVLGNDSLVKYTILVNNTGMFNATNVTVVDTLPEGLTFEGQDSNVTEGVHFKLSDDRKTLTWTVEKLTDAIEFYVTVRTVAVGNLTNNVTVNSTENKTTVNDTETVDVVPVILTVNKTANVTVVGKDAYVTYTIIVNNTSKVTATGVVVIDSLPGGLEYISSSPNVSQSGYGVDISDDNRILTLNVAKLKGVAELYITVKTTELGNFTNNVTVTSKENRTPVNDSETIEVVPENVTVVKSANVTECYVDGLVKFTINVTNTGRITAKDINVTDLLDSAFEVQEIGNKSYLIYDDVEMILWNLPSLDVGNSTTLEVTVKILTNGTFNNTATAVTPNSNETTSTVNVTAEKIPTHVSVGNITTYPDTDVTIPINVTADDNKTFSGNVTITFPDGSSQIVEIINGTGKVTWHVPSDYTPDKYNDTVKFAGDDKYLPSSGNGTITVLPIPTHTTVGNVTGKAGQNVTIPVNVTSDDKKPFNGNVTLNLPDGTNKTVEIINGTGKVTWTIPDDYNGTYNDNATYPGNDTYLPSNGTGIITVIPKIPTHVSVGNITTYPDTDVTIPINVTADDGIPFNGNVTITFPDGTNKTVEIVNGTGKVTWHVPSDYTPDKYNDTVRFPGNENYFPSSGNGTITVLPIPTHTSVANVTGERGKNVTIPINVTADDNKPVNGNVTITLPDGTNQTVEIINGTGNATWLVPQEYVPKYNDSAKFPGDETYLPSNGTGIITVIPIPTHVSVGNITTYPDKDITIPINVTAEDGEPVNGNITITLPDGTNKTVEIVNGTGNITWHVPSDYTPDKYNDTVKFPGDDKYMPSNGTGIVTVIPVPTHISVGNITTYPDTDAIIPINVITDDGIPFNGNVTMTFPDGTNKTVEIVNGTGKVTWHVPNDYTPEKYPDSIKFPGNDKYLPSNGTGVINVIQIPTHVSVGNITTYPDSDVVIPINVTADDDVPFNGNVTITLPDGSNQTVEIVNGTGNVKWHVPADYTQDKYNDTVRFSGNNKYLPSNGTGVINVIQIPTHVSVGNITTHPGADVTIPINVTADDGIPFNGNVTITLPDGSTQTVEIVNGTGNVKWHVPSDYTPDKYNDTVKFQGNGKYLPSEGVGTITVVKVPVDIIVGNITAKPGDDVTIPIKVIPRDGSVFNGNVTVELPDGTRKVVEIIDGEGSVDWTVPEDYEGDYLVKVSFDGNDFYYPANGTGIVTVIVEPPAPDNHTSPAKEVKSPVKTGLAKYETGNPILALLMVVVLLGIGIKRKE